MKLDKIFLFITIYDFDRSKDKTCNIVIKVCINFTNVKDLNTSKIEKRFITNLIWNMVSNFFIHIHHLKKKIKSKFFYFFKKLFSLWN